MWLSVGLKLVTPDLQYMRLDRPHLRCGMHIDTKMDRTHLCYGQLI
jgi:hypothetical protein